MAQPIEITMKVGGDGVVTTAAPTRPSIPDAPRRVLRFTWRGAVIPDIETWASLRGEAMVEFLAVLDFVSYDADGAPTFVRDEYLGAAPASFFDNLVSGGPLAYASYRYTELARRAPVVK